MRSAQGRSVLVVVSVVVTLVSSSSSGSGNSNECELYLAPSTIPNAGLGIFTSVEKEKGDSVGYGADVMLPIYDIIWHQGEDFFWPWNDYVWNGASMGMSHHSVLDQVEAYAPGLDCSINCHLGLINVDKTSPRYDYHLLPHRSQHPAAGSMTPYFNATTFVIADTIPAGSELFKFYGDLWFTTRDHLFPNIPLSQDYPDAEILATNIKKIIHNEKWNLTTNAHKDLYSLITNIDSRLTNALPRTLQQLDQLIQHGIRSLHQPKAIRPNLSFDNAARCLDNIIVQKSTIPGAGRGAFASRPLQDGIVITGSPLMHLPNGSRFEMYHYDERKNEKNESLVVGYQILKNYCWAHPDSTLRLCPYGAGVNLINHSEEKQNVQIRWAPAGEIGHDPSWFSWDPDSMESQDIPHLAWDFVAVRDIDEGEELFLDYGRPWVEAWEDHVQRWKPSQDVSYKPAAQWNADTDVLRTIFEEPYPSNIELRCHEMLINEEMFYYVDENSEDNHGRLWDISLEGIPCHILDRIIDEDHGYSYTVALVGVEGSNENNSNDSNFQHNNENENQTILKRIPRDMFAFRDQKYSSDIHMEGVFRQEATIPDNLIPPLWRNLRNGNNKPRLYKDEGEL